ncbi:MAG: cephalosporin hydroxylase [Symploca sp. SIO3C6]|uniref:Cephalosporin hydroxylase n=1 Tax=Symploca sp. SIO1C4 TaxID=2607765 RepID=A0A6B3NCN9_9CYAN|nr:cephalosporin hydroxylase [Symploca sp. SIO3C6]NER27401.1 cephalosporin hydroxylase [Symploca sp. SIO1C4]NET07674.1 cephalosporin hydroxylase [Symploca sp. SIO2B6]
MGYQKAVQQARHRQELFKADRFVKISDRIDQGDIPTRIWEKLLGNYLLQSWKGMILSKGVTEIGLYPMLLYELQPKTIIEIGAFNGGSAVWFADHLELFGIEGSVYSIDIDLSLLDEKAKTDSRVNFLEGDGNKLGTVLPPELLSTLPHPWLVIEDAAPVEIVGLLEFFHKNGLENGDYLIIEDTSQSIWDCWSGNWEDQEELAEGREKMDKLRHWLIKHEDEYLVDTYYLDMYGYNGSKNWNSILKKV